jgi:vacuolar-type H+-ATPase subunit I/STV1
MKILVTRETLKKVSDWLLDNTSLVNVSQGGQRIGNVEGFYYIDTEFRDGCCCLCIGDNIESASTLTDKAKEKLIKLYPNPKEKSEISELTSNIADLEQREADLMSALERTQESKADMKRNYDELRFMLAEVHKKIGDFISPI